MIHTRFIILQEERKQSEGAPGSWLSIFDFLYPLSLSLSYPQHHMLSSHFVSSRTDWAGGENLRVGTVLLPVALSVLGTLPCSAPSEAVKTVATQLSGLKRTVSEEIFVWRRDRREVHTWIL